MRTFFYKVSFNDDPVTRHVRSGVIRTSLSPRSETFFVDFLARVADEMNPPRNPDDCFLEYLSLLDVES